eukprot:3940299-Rhodomonas_salina.6
MEMLGLKSSSTNLLPSEAPTDKVKLALTIDDDSSLFAKGKKLFDMSKHAPARMLQEQKEKVFGAAKKPVRQATFKQVQFCSAELRVSVTANVMMRGA